MAHFSSRTYDKATTPVWRLRRRPRKALRRVLLSAVVIAFICLFTIFRGANHVFPARSGLRMPVKTTSGLVQGIVSDERQVTTFRGIPFAASTAGKNRWRAPQPPEQWDGVRVADRFGDACPQERVLDLNTSEDCLSLNIWTPASSPGDKLPVYVWIHGGRYLFGSGSQPEYDGHNLASKGIIVVTINYRLGIFGFLAHARLSRESGQGSGNYGLLDQIAALQWIQSNIAAFGGDPGQVTVGGQSAGAAFALHLIDSPLAKGLFRGAIVQSAALHPRDKRIGSLPASYRTRGSAEQQGKQTLVTLGVTSMSEMRNLTVEKLLLQNRISDGIYEASPMFRPVMDGWVMGHNYEQAMVSGSQSDVAVLVGNNHDDGLVSDIQLNPNDFLDGNSETYAELVDKYWEFYPARSDAEAATSALACARDSVRISTWLWGNLRAEKSKSPTYAYYWTQAPPVAAGSGNSSGAYHGSEIPYAFDNLDKVDLEWTREDRRVAQKTSTYWINFVKTGDPNGGWLLPTWPRSREDTAQVMVLGKQMQKMKIASQEKIDFWAKYFGLQRKAW